MKCWPLLLALAATLTPSIAIACGGVFCAAPNPMSPGGPKPIDQTAERILFDVDLETETTAATVEIRYEGDPEAFAWIIPVRGVPEVSDGDADELDAIMAMTEVSFGQPPINDLCLTATSPNSSDDGCGCSFPAMNASDEAPATFEGEREAAPPVPTEQTVFPRATGSTGTYDYVVLEATDAQELVTWLQENDYNVTENMVPAMQPYLEEGHNYLAVRLSVERETKSIPPITMTYPGTKTTIPIRLTAVAARPHMSILVFIRSTSGYRPENWPVYEIGSEDLIIDENGQVNYFDRTARISDENDGKVWFFESSFRRPTEASPTGFETISRYYARMSPEQMTEDPLFGPDNTNFVVKPRVLQFPAEDALYCNQNGQARLITARVPSACAFAYCGEGTCVEEGDVVGCECPIDQVAMPYASPAGQRVTCVPRENPLGVTDESAGVGTAAGPCARFDCGLGRCLVKGGFPTCQCEIDAIAVSQGSGVTCRLFDSEAKRFGPGAGEESRGDFRPIDPDTGEPPPAMGGFLVFAFGMLWLRLRMRVRE